MPWVKFDDQYPMHRKIRPLSDPRYRLANEAIFWCARNTTDGVILEDELTEIRSRAKRSDADDLVRRGIWHAAGYDCDSKYCPPPGPSGWVVHDYWDYQPTKQKVDKDREAARERQRKWRERKRGDDGQFE